MAKAPNSMIRSDNSGSSSTSLENKTKTAIEKKIDTSNSNQLRNILVLKLVNS